MRRPDGQLPHGLRGEHPLFRRCLAATLALCRRACAGFAEGERLDLALLQSGRLSRGLGRRAGDLLRGTAGLAAEGPLVAVVMFDRPHIILMRHKVLASSARVRETGSPGLVRGVWVYLFLLGLRPPDSLFGGPSHSLLRRRADTVRPGSLPRAHRTRAAPAPEGSGQSCFSCFLCARCLSF